MSRLCFVFFSLLGVWFTTLGEAATLKSMIESLNSAPVLRCSSPGCDAEFIKITFNYFLFACESTGCKSDRILRVIPSGKTSYIHQYCILNEPVHSPSWSVRVQADLFSTGARVVLVAVPSKSRLENKLYKRPFILGEIIPRNQLYLINSFLRAFCGGTNAWYTGKKTFPFSNDLCQNQFPAPV